VLSFLDLWEFRSLNFIYSRTVALEIIRFGFSEGAHLAVRPVPIIRIDVYDAGAGAEFRAIDHP
jgi:hypothetical protein